MTKRQLLGMGMVAFFVAGLSACATTTPKPEATQKDQAEATQPAEAKGPEESKPGTVLIALEREQGMKESFTTRIFANPDFMHISDSRSPADYILFNRAEQTIYSVNNDDRTILVIHKKPVTIQPPIEIDYEEESQPSSAIPKIEGQQATHYRFTANGKHCYDAVVLPEDYMPEMWSAMREFRLVLAGEHASTVDRMPRDSLDACDLALNVFDPVKHLDHGIPIREWDRNGYQRFVKDYRKNITVPTSIFKLPADFRRYTAAEMLGNGK
jgi:hypothetical protein